MHFQVFQHRCHTSSFLKNLKPKHILLIILKDTFSFLDSCDVEGEFRVMCGVEEGVCPDTCCKDSTENCYEKKGN